MNKITMNKIKTHTKPAASKLACQPEKFEEYGDVIALGVAPIEAEFGVLAVFEYGHKPLPERIDGVLVYAMAGKLM